MRYVWRILLLATVAAGADEYTGPRPPKADVLYLVHASTLVATETTEAQQEGKNNDTFSVSGASSSARTPLAEPIFLLRSEKIKADSLELYRFEVKGGRRQLTLSRKRKEGSGPFHLSITKLDKDLYRVEADEALENGEYSLSPSGSNVAFCFQVY
jgi:hypothetical protein